MVKIRTRQDEDNMVPFSKMVEYSFTAFMEQIQHGMSKTFYCHQQEVRDIKKELDVSEWRTSCLSVIFTFAHVNNEDMLFTQAANERESVGARYESIYYTGALASESRARSEKRCLLSSL
jgi:hypothetical protein